MNHMSDYGSFTLRNSELPVSACLSLSLSVSLLYAVCALCGLARVVAVRSRCLTAGSARSFLPGGKDVLLLVDVEVDE